MAVISAASHVKGAFLVILALFVMSSKAYDEQSLSLFNRKHASFATDLYTTLASGEQNNSFVLSPFAVHLCGALLYSGADGQTSEEIARVLRLAKNNKSKMANSFHTTLEKHSSENLQIANKIYIDEDVFVKPKFKEFAIKHFYTDIESLSFTDQKTVETINKWIANITHNHINTILHEDSLDENTTMVLTNSIYFDLKWEKPFANATKGLFWVSETESRDVEIINQISLLKTANIRELSATVVQLPYRDQNISMLVIIPNKRFGWNEVEENLFATNIINLQNRLVEEYLNFSLPKFRIESTINLKDVFSKMGIKLVFTKSGNLSNMVADENVFVSAALHKTVISVTEDEVESDDFADSETEEHASPRTIKVDQPFLFAICSKSVILFIGKFLH